MWQPIHNNHLAFVSDAATRTNNFLLTPATVSFANQTDCQIWHDLLAAVDRP
jgi:hypothetical protein